MNSTTENSLGTFPLSTRTLDTTISDEITTESWRTTTYYYEDTTEDKCYDMGCFGQLYLTLIIVGASVLFLVCIIIPVCCCVYRKRQQKARLEAALTINANMAAMNNAGNLTRNEPNNLPPGYYYSNNNSAIIVINNPPLSAYDDVMMTAATSTSKLTKDAPPTYEDATYIVNN